MLFPLPSESLTKIRSDFSDQDFRRLIAQKGLNLQWTQSAICPCISKTNDLGMDLDFTPNDSIQNDFNANCPSCSGTGLIYHSSQNIQAIVTNADGEYINARFGGYREGVLNLSLNPEHLAGFGDRFEMLDSVMVYQETIQDNGLDTLPLRFPIQSRTMKLSTGEITVGVPYATYSTSSDGLTVGSELIEGTHFEVSNHEISWLNKPSNVEKFSFNYYIRPVYTCIGYPNAFRDTHIRKKSPVDLIKSLPVRIQCKLEFLEE